LPEEKVDSKPYRYARTFETAKREKPIAEMYKDVLTEYIRKILGTGKPDLVEPEAA